MTVRWLIAIGGSAGSVAAAQELLGEVPANRSACIVVVLHRHPRHPENLTALLASVTTLRVRVVEDKDPIGAGLVYVAPPDYHVLINRDETLNLSVDPPLRYSRPSIDVSFRSAGDVYADRCAAVLLSGANEDGAEGLAWVRARGGIVACQTPDTATHPAMPSAGIRQAGPRVIAEPAALGRFVADLVLGRD